jgi:hypothetical protein
MYACEADKLSGEYKQENARLVQDKLASDATLAEMRDELDMARRDLHESDSHFHQALATNDVWAQVDLQQRELVAQSAVREKALNMLLADRDRLLKEKDVRWKHLTDSFIKLSSQVQLCESSAEAQAEASARVALDKDRLLGVYKSMLSKWKTLHASVVRNRCVTEDTLAATRKELAEVRVAFNEYYRLWNEVMAANDDWVRVDKRQRELLAKAALREEASMKALAEKGRALEESAASCVLVTSTRSFGSQMALLSLSRETSTSLSLQKDHIIELYRNAYPNLLLADHA